MVAASEGASTIHRVAGGVVGGRGLGCVDEAAASPDASPDASLDASPDASLDALRDGAAALGCIMLSVLASRAQTAAAVTSSIELVVNVSSAMPSVVEKALTLRMLIRWSLSDAAIVDRQPI